MPLIPHGVTDSAWLHGKLHVVEDDSRTGLCDRQQANCHGDGIVATRNVDEMIKKAQTNMLTAGMKGLGLYFYDIPGGGWYGRPDKARQTERFWQAMASTRARVAMLMKANAGGRGGFVDRMAPQVALLVDDISPAFWQLSGGPGAHCKNRPTSASSTDNLEAVRRGFWSSCGLSHRVHSAPVRSLSWMGAPFRQYLLSDVLSPAFPANQIKLAIFANALQLPSALLSAVKEKLASPLADGSTRTLLFIWAAGIMLPSTGEYDPAGLEALVGMGVKDGATKRSLASTLVNGADKSAAVGPSTFGEADYAVSPWFYAAEPGSDGGMSTGICGKALGPLGVEVLGRYTALTASSSGSTEPPSLIRARGDNCTMAYSAVPGLPASLYRTLARDAGVHIYLSGGDAVNVTVETAANVIMIKCGQSATQCVGMTLSLPGTESVAAVYHDDLTGAPPQFSGAGVATPVCRGCTSVACEPLDPGAVRLYWLRDDE